MAKPKPAAPTPKELDRHMQAQRCGSLAGMQDKIVQLQQAIIDITGRCSFLKELQEKQPELTDDEMKFLSEVQVFCDSRFGNLFSLTEKLMLINIRLSKQQVRST